MYFNAKETVILGLTAMIKVLAQMKNLRRGHDTQGRLKKINIDQTYGGYANFMAPDRMEKIRCEVKEANSKAGNNVFDERILKPRTETYLMPEWDEMIPFPTDKSFRSPRDLVRYKSADDNAPHSVESPLQRLRDQRLRLQPPHHPTNPR